MKSRIGSESSSCVVFVDDLKFCETRTFKRHKMDHAWHEYTRLE